MGGQILPTIAEVALNFPPDYIPEQVNYRMYQILSTYLHITALGQSGKGRNHGENLVATGDRVKVSENLGATVVAPVAPVVTSLI